MKKLLASLYIPLPLRLTCFFLLVLAAALFFFGNTVYQTAKDGAYKSLDDLLKSRALAVWLGKGMLATGPGTPLPFVLPSVKEGGNDGVSIRVFRFENDQWFLFASTSQDLKQDPVSPSITGIEAGPAVWDENLRQKALTFSGDQQGAYSSVLYNGETIRVYTMLSLAYEPSSQHVIQTARSTRDIEQNLLTLRLLLSREAALVLAIALAGGLLLTYGVLATVRRMTRTAQAISTSRDFSRRVSGKMLAGRDEMVMLAETFNQMLDSLEEAHQQQKRFVADASHELRAPITSIRCNLDLLAKAPDLPAEEVQGALADARAEAERMGRLVNDLLQLAHSDEAGANGIHGSGWMNGENDKPDNSKVWKNGYFAHRQVELDSVLLDVYRQFQSLHTNELEGTIENGKRGPKILLQHTRPVLVNGNADQLKQALVALLDNAVKYTPQEGYISLSLNADEKLATVKVSDTGIGIPAEDVPHIFERFYRANRARTRDRGGSGLGLSIVQSIMQEHRGMVEVESTPGKGSTFLLKLPLATGQ